jgi:hypothetical protein
VLQSIIVAQPDLPSQCIVLDESDMPLHVSDTKAQALVVLLLRTLLRVQWICLPESWVTWENKSRLHEEYTYAPALGSGSQEEENVETKILAFTQDMPNEAQARTGGGHWSGHCSCNAESCVRKSCR